MRDIDGNEVEVGYTVKVLEIAEELLNGGLIKEELPLHLAMIGKDYEIDELVENGRKASVTVEWNYPEGTMIGGLYMLSHEFRLVKKKKIENGDNDT